MNDNIMRFLIKASVVLIIGCVFLGLMIKIQDKVNLRGTAIGVVAQVATTSTVTVGPGTNKTMVFTPSTFCASRTISTGSQGIVLSFDTATSTAYPGHGAGIYQAASTTKEYDSGVYGCGNVSAYGYVASTTISLLESR